MGRPICHRRAREPRGGGHLPDDLPRPGRRKGSMDALCERRKACEQHDILGKRQRETGRRHRPAIHPATRRDKDHSHGDLLGSSQSCNSARDESGTGATPTSMAPPATTPGGSPATDCCNAAAWSDAIDKWQAPYINDESKPLWYRGMLFNELYVLADGGTFWGRQVGDRQEAPCILCPARVFRLRLLRHLGCSLLRLSPAGEILAGD